MSLGNDFKFFNLSIKHFFSPGAHNPYLGNESYWGHLLILRSFRWLWVCSCEIISKLQHLLSSSKWRFGKKSRGKFVRESQPQSIPNVSIMNYQITNLKIVYHRSSWLTNPSSVWKVTNSQVLPFLSLDHQGYGLNSILTLVSQGVFYFSNLLLMHPMDSQYSTAP